MLDCMEMNGSCMHHCKFLVRITKLKKAMSLWLSLQCNGMFFSQGWKCTGRIKSLSHMALLHSVCPFKVCCSRSEGIVKHVCPASVPRWTPRLMKPKSSVFSLSTIDVVAGRALMFYGPKWMRPPLTLSENCAKRWKHLPPWVPEHEMNDTYWDNEKTHNKCQTSFRCSCVCVCAWLEISTFMWDKFEGMHSGFPKDICTRGFLSKPLPLYWLRYQKLGVESMALMAQYVLPLCTVKMKAIQASCESCCIPSRGRWQWQARFLGGFALQRLSTKVQPLWITLAGLSMFIHLYISSRLLDLSSWDQQNSNPSRTLEA